MPILGLDANGGVAVEHLAGREFVIDYVSADPAKCITPARAKAYRAAGKALVLFYEDGADDALGGANAGAAKALIARPVLAAIEWPADKPVHFACDFSPVGAQVSACVAAAKAFAAGIARPEGIYGNVNVCTAAHAAGIKYAIQFGEGRAPGITIYQGYPPVDVGGQLCDPDEALAADYGQWASPPPPPPPKPTLFRTLKGFANLLGRHTWNTELPFAEFASLKLTGGGAKAQAKAIDAGGHLRVRVAKAMHGSILTVKVYRKP